MRRVQLLDAGYELLGTRGAAQVTVRGVCRAAGLTERYFYESFADRVALLVAVHARVADEARVALAAAVAAAPAEPLASATAAVEAFVELLHDDPRRGRVLLSEVFADEALTRAGVELIPSFAALLAEQIVAVYADAPDAPDRLDAELTAVALVGALAHLLLGLARRHAAGLARPAGRARRRAAARGRARQLARRVARRPARAPHLRARPRQLPI